jgi:Protein of unknown function (DUF4254)
MPPARDLAAACARLVEQWHRRTPPLEWDAAHATLPVRDDWIGATERLSLINCFQWHLEDDCRAAYDDAQRLAELKREIDESNRRRVGAIDAIDSRMTAELDGATADPTAPVALVTPGALLDRISILELKRFHAPAPDVVSRLEEELADVCDGLDRLVASLVARETRLKVYGIVKLYGT